jgi:mannose-6-phosphate isomerase-like protein (cupin superfamily)
MLCGLALFQMKLTDTTNAEHYIWGDGCDGWHFLKRDDVSIIMERVPPGKAEVKHYHNSSRQFFFILEGVGTIEFDNELVQLNQHQGIEIAPHMEHKFRNNSASDVRFMVVSFPKAHGDRVAVE